MPQEFFDTDNAMIQLTMALKLQQLRRGPLPSLTWENLKDFLNGYLWKNRAPANLNRAVDNIMCIRSEDVVRYLALKAVKDGSRESLDDFGDLIGGN